MAGGTIFEIEDLARFIAIVDGIRLDDRLNLGLGRRLNRGLDRGLKGGLDAIWD